MGWESLLFQSQCQLTLSSVPNLRHTTTCPAPPQLLSKSPRNICVLLPCTVRSAPLQVSSEAPVTLSSCEWGGGEGLPAFCGASSRASLCSQQMGALLIFLTAYDFCAASLGLEPEGSRTDEPPMGGP